MFKRFARLKNKSVIYVKKELGKWGRDAHFLRPSQMRWRKSFH